MRELAVFFQRVFIFRFTKLTPSLSRIIRLPEYSAPSSASTMPPLLSRPLYKAGEHAVGQPFKLTCKCCGKEFESKRSNTLFCGPNCRVKFYRQEAAETRKRECVCENCGKTFTTTRNNAKYCCDECRTQANRKMQKERNAAKKAASAVPVLQTGKSSEKTKQKTA